MQQSGSEIPGRVRAGCAKRVAMLVTLTLLWVTASAVHAEPAAAPKGHLVIMGGAMKLENAAVYHRIIELVGPGRLAVLPTASGVPQESGKGTVEDFVHHGGEAFVMDITTQTAALASDDATVKLLGEQRGVFFTGGDQSRITAVFRPSGGTTPGLMTLRQLLAQGGVIAGTSAGAAMMSDPMITGGNSEEALTSGVLTLDDRGVGVGPGMGFFPYGITDQHFLRRGRLGRLLVACEATSQSFGFGVEENTALDVDLASDSIMAIGRRGSLFLDLREASRDGHARSGVRISLLGAGDAVHGRTGEVTLAAGKQPLQVAAVPGDAPSPGEDAWGRQVIPQMIETLALSPATRIAATSQHFVIELSEDDRTRFYQVPGGDAWTLSAVDVLLAIRPRTTAQTDDRETVR